jgi:hypothetical protein
MSNRQAVLPKEGAHGGTMGFPVFERALPIPKD